MTIKYGDIAAGAMQGLKDRREKALWAIRLLAYTLHALDAYSPRLRTLASSAVMSEGYTRLERVARLFLCTLERVRAGILIKASAPDTSGN